MYRLLGLASTSVAVLLLLAATGSAQDPSDARDGTPRFWLASAGSRPGTLVPLDVQRTPVLGRRLALQLDNVTLKDALAQIVTQSGFRLGYSDDLLPPERRVSLSAKGITTVAALTDVLFGTGLDVVFLHDGKALLRRSTEMTAQGGTLVGRVVDSATGRGVSTAQVLLNGTRWHTETDSAGRYRLSEIDSGTYVLLVRRLGYAKQSRKVAVRGEREDTVNVTLVSATTRLGDLVSTATGSQRRRDIGNAITTIRADSVMQTAPIHSLTDLLENRVPGLTVQHTSGAPGDPSKLRLRGLGSVLRSNDPIVVVDGVRIYAAQSEARSGNLTNFVNSNAPAPAPSPLDQIDPNIIEKIEVFKGSSAATLYGADAANGVIVVTTKRGRAGPTRWSGNITHSRTTSLGQYPMGYYRWGHDSLALESPSSQSHYCTLLAYRCFQDSLVRFQALNEPNLTFLAPGHNTDLSLTAQGGTQTLQYSITGTYGDEMGPLRLPKYAADQFQTQFNHAPPDWMQRPLQYTKWNVNSAVTANLGPTASITLSTMLSRSEQQRSSLENQLASISGIYVDTANSLVYTPFYGGRVSDPYTLGTPSRGSGGIGIGSSASQLLADYFTKRTASTITVTTGLSAQWQPRSWFNGTGQVGLNITPRDDRLFLPAGLTSANDSGTAAVGTGRSLVGTFGLQGSLRKRLGRGFLFETNLGANLTTTNTSDLETLATGLPPGSSSISGATRISGSQQGSNTSVYGWYIEPRISGQRIALSTGLRLDGGSAYGVRLTRSGSGGGGFLRSLLSLPKLNGSWVISEEPWFPFTTLFSSLRLRGAYGQAQVQPGPADRLRLYTGTAEQSTSQLGLTSLGNTALRPERSTELESGFDADLLDNRVSLEVTAYRKLQVDALMAMLIPPSVNGGGSQLTNIGNIRNTGLDVTLRLTPVRLPLLTWSTELNYNRNNNILTKLGDGVVANKTQGVVEGYPVGSRWARPILGFADQNEDGVLQPGEIQVGDSLVFVGRLQPASHSSLFTNVALFGGAVRVSAGFSYDAGQTQVDQTLRTNFTLVRALVDPSAPLSEQAAIFATTRTSDPTDYGLMQEVSTFRFQSLSVDYRVPAQVARLFRAQQLTVAVQGSNLALHSTYHGKDPNVNIWSPGEAIADGGQLPTPRLWQVRVNMNF